MPRKTPFGNFSQRASVELFNRRVREDPAYLDTLVRLKSFQEYHRSPGVQTLEYPGIHVDEPTTFDGESKRVKEAYKYYQFLMKLSRTWDDKFGLATIYVNLTFVRSIRHPAMEVVYYLTKAGAAAEAVSRIIRMSVTGWSMDLAILALNKVLIDVIERASRRREPGDRGER
ncbi:MAG: hypothetical protein HY815_01925 [Candidatus Riflebacteria bacterium]|nr:hypothetical protein [Candidatus Riflebacteria bacterium]